jgi:FAD/FMN-containing dehydrogenase
MASIDDSSVRALSGSFSGELLRPGDEGYDRARQIYNGLIDTRPALIARCQDTSDIKGAIAFARESGLALSVRGGGHSVAGRCLVEGGVTIDLSKMRAIEVDSGAATARAEGGATWAEFNDATAQHGLATTGGVISTTGIAGLTLGGGLGWLMGKYGLAADNMTSVELVTADGDVLTVDADQHQDLFWALRGGSGNFGVAASLTYRLYPLVQITGGLVAYPFPAARDVLSFYREFTRSIPDELIAFSGLVHAPDGSGAPLAVIAVCHCGPPDQAEIDLKPLRDFGEPALSQVGPMPYPAVNTMLDAAYPPGSLNYWKSTFLTTLGDDVLEAMIERFEACPSPMTSVLLEHWHGAATRVGVSDTAVPHREDGYNFAITSVWSDPTTNDANIEWTRAEYEALRPRFAGRRYVNYLAQDDGEDVVKDAFGPNYARLQEVKRAYDSEGVFNANLNVRPSAA